MTNLGAELPKSRLPERRPGLGGGGAEQPRREAVLCGAIYVA